MTLDPRTYIVGVAAAACLMDARKAARRDRQFMAGWSLPIFAIEWPVPTRLPTFRMDRGQADPKSPGANCPERGVTGCSYTDKFSYRNRCHQHRSRPRLPAVQQRALENGCRLLRQRPSARDPQETLSAAKSLPQSCRTSTRAGARRDGRAGGWTESPVGARRPNLGRTMSPRGHCVFALQVCERLSRLPRCSLPSSVMDSCQRGWFDSSKATHMTRACR